MTKYTHGALAHFDVAGDDEENLRGFYHGLFGWRMDAKGPGYTLVETPEGGPNGAIVEMEKSTITPGITVKSLAHTLEQAEASGGKVIMKETDNGWVKKAQITDPAGNLLTLIEI